jgi:hypothetical protein
MDTNQVRMKQRNKIIKKLINSRAHGSVFCNVGPKGIYKAWMVKFFKCDHCDNFICYKMMFIPT